MIVIGHSFLYQDKDGAVWCMMFIGCRWLLFTGSKHLEHISRIRTEYLPNIQIVDNRIESNTEHWNEQTTEQKVEQYVNNWQQLMFAITVEGGPRK